MSNFDDIFEPAPQAEDFDKEAWAAKKKAERDERYSDHFGGKVREIQSVLVGGADRYG